MYTYSLIANSDYILRSDGAIIPNIEDNTDYQNYLAWVAVGNMATPAAISVCQQQQTSMLSAACQQAIMSGFTSSALGSVYNYGSQMTDQANINSVANSLSGGSIKCAPSNGTWVMVAHSQIQAQAVIGSFIAWLNACQSQLVNLTTQVNASTTSESIQAITWTNPA